MSWKKSATDGGFPSLHCSPERGLQAFPLKGAPFQGHPRWKNCEQGFDKVESLWKGRDGAWGREGKPFSRKVFP
ncbi:hypothetical protein, partial [Bilophila wadsworthia]